MIFYFKLLKLRRCISWEIGFNLPRQTIACVKPSFANVGQSFEATSINALLWLP